MKVMMICLQLIMPKTTIVIAMKLELNFRGLLWGRMDPDPKGEELPVVSREHSQEKDSSTGDSTAHCGSSRGSC